MRTKNKNRHIGQVFAGLALEFINLSRGLFNGALKILVGTRRCFRIG